MCEYNVNILPWKSYEYSNNNSATQSRSRCQEKRSNKQINIA